MLRCTVKAGWSSCVHVRRASATMHVLHGVRVSACWLVSPQGGFSLSLFCSYLFCGADTVSTSSN